MAPELKDKSWHYLCAMWENEADTASLFVDGTIRVRGQGKLIESFISWDGILHLGDKRDVAALSNCILTCVRLWKGAITEGEVKTEYGRKKCDNHEQVSMTWPLFKRGYLTGNALWTNSSSLLEEDLGMGQVYFYSPSYSIIGNKIVLLCTDKVAMLSILPVS